MNIKKYCPIQVLWLFLITASSFVPEISAWFSSVTTTTQSTNPTLTIPKNVKLLILPEFGNDSSDYYLQQSPQGSLVSSLVQRGWDLETQIYVMPVQRIEWLQVFWKGIFDLQFWQGTASPTRPAFYWYLKRIANCINEITTESTTTNSTTTSVTEAAESVKRNMDPARNDDCTDTNVKIILIGHSAGGWLARAAVGYGSRGDIENNFPVCIDLKKIGGIVTLGAPNLPPPPTVMDMTRGALKLTCQNFPGAYHSNEIFYITVIGDAVKGIKQERKSLLEPTSITGFAYNSYEAVCGDGETTGDGVVPIAAAHLEGAVQLNLDGIFHSINVPERWYGSDSVIDSWHNEMLVEFARKSGRGKSQVEMKNPFASIFTGEKSGRKT